MKLDFDTPIRDLKGELVKEGEDILTFSRVVVSAMFVPLQEDQAASGDQKVKQFKIAMLADKGGEATLTVEDVALIKQRVAKVYGALVVGRIYEIIEGGLQDDTDSVRTNGARRPGVKPGAVAHARPT